MHKKFGIAYKFHGIQATYLPTSHSVNRPTPIITPRRGATKQNVHTTLELTHNNDNDNCIMTRDNISSSSTSSFRNWKKKYKKYHGADVLLCGDGQTDERTTIDNILFPKKGETLDQKYTGELVWGY